MVLEINKNSKIPFQSLSSLSGLRIYTFFQNSCANDTRGIVINTNEYQSNSRKINNSPRLNDAVYAI